MLQCYGISLAKSIFLIPFNFDMLRKNVLVETQFESRPHLNLNKNTMFRALAFCCTHKHVHKSHRDVETTHGN